MNHVTTPSGVQRKDTLGPHPCLPKFPAPDLLEAPVGSSETPCSDVHQTCSDFHKVMQYIHHATCNLWQGLGNSFSDEKLFIPNGINKNYTDIPCFVVLHFILFLRYCIFYKSKVCGNPTLSKSMGTIFQLDLLTLCLCVTLRQFLKYFEFCHYCYIRYGKQ